MQALRRIVLALLLFTLPAATCLAQATSDTVVIDAAAPSHPFPHFWEQMFGSGRAILTLRESYRRDLREVEQSTGFKYVRFHNIFHDEIGVYDEDQTGTVSYNFSYVDQVYDGLLANGVKPFVELSFMPKKLAAADKPHAFWYKPNVSPPKDYEKWDNLISAFVKHLIDRYGIDEVASWYFEVWNEPNIDFWVGEPKQSTYWQLYDHTASTIKKISPRLRVGGPATAQAAWVDVFIQHAAENHIPVDFVSSHVYGNDKSTDVFGTEEAIPRNKMVCRAVAKVHDQIKASSMPTLPLIWSEFNASYFNETAVTDSIFMGPWLADTIRQCDGIVDSMSYWSFSDVFEEQGVVKAPFYGGFGLLAAGGIPKPALAAFTILHRLGDQRIAVDSDSVLATRSGNGLVLALWNYAAPEEPGAPRTINLSIRNAKPRHAYISRVDAQHGDPKAVYEKLGNPRYPTQSQIQQLRQAAALPPPEEMTIRDGQLRIDLPPHGLAVVELK
jgi:xylan 1,4-beta-xylosidase